MSASIKLYDELAAWWPLLSSPDDYAEEAEFYRHAMEQASTRPIRSVLELGSGGGNNASHLTRHFSMTLVDPSPGMLAVSRALNPACEHVEGDMRTVRLRREFDAVFVHDAICYMTTLDDLLDAIETGFVHCRPGGVALFCPDFTSETFRPGTDHGGHDGDLRSLRYLEWMWDPDPSDTTYTVDYAYLLREPDGSARVVHDRHIEGLFPRDTWLETMRMVCFEASAQPFTHSEVDFEPEVFIGVRP
jgi:SAM-dependent methyltransferase